jgi:signal peptidase I
VASDGSTPPAGTSRRKLPLWLETVVLLAVAIVLAVIVKTFFVQAFYIPSGSMKPGLRVNDRIMVQKVSYWGDDGPDRGEIVVFEDPGNWLEGEATGPTNELTKLLAKIGLFPTGGHLVKRVIGVGGDTVHCCDDEGRLEINGVGIDEDEFIAPQSQCDGPMPSGCSKDWTVTVPDGDLFVMGDNRAASADSSARLCDPGQKRCDPDAAFVPVDLVVGKVFALVWPLGHFRLIGTPDVFGRVPDPSQR